MGRATKATKKASVQPPPLEEEPPAWWVYICPSITGVQRQCVQVCVRVMGGAVTDSLDVVEGTGGTRPGTPPVQSYVICPPSQYDSYLTLRENSYVPLVTPTWIFRSVLQNSQVLLPTDRFSANPKKVFSSVVLYCVQVDVDPRKVIAALMTNGGGQLVSLPTNAATHVLCLRNSGSDYTQAIEWQRQTKPMLDDVASNVALVRDGCDRFTAGGCKGSLPDMVVQYLLGQCGLLSPQIVSYDWVQECVKQGRRVPESDFSFPDAGDLLSATSSAASSANELTVQDLIETCQKQTIYPQAPASDDLWKDLAHEPATTNAMAGEAILFARHIPTSLRLRMMHALEALGATVLSPSADDVLIQVPKAAYVVCGYQSGAEYTTALKMQKPVVSMQWVAACIAAKAVVATSPPTSLVRQALYAPSRRHGGIAGMEGCVITLSGFNGRSSPTRDDIQALVRLTGACYLSVLSRSHTTHLLCLEPSGEKFKRSLAWGLTNVVKFEWLVKTVQHWEKAPEAAYSWLEQPAVAASAPASDAASSSHDTTTNSMTSSTKVTLSKPGGKKGPKFQVDDALDALEDDQRTTPLKATVATPSKEPSTDSAAGTAVTTPVQLRKAIATNSIENPVVAKKGRAATATKPPAKGKKRPACSTEAADDDVQVVDQPNDPPPPAKSRRTAAAQRKETADEKPSNSAPKTSAAPAVTAKPKASRFVFLLTGSHEDMAMDASIVMALGGTVLETKRAFDPACTHIICKDLRRTEKVVCGIAAGKWILYPAYLKQCMAKGTFVDEAPFEWGAPTASKRTAKGSLDHRIWPLVAQYWRQEITSGRSKGAFHGRKFGLHCADAMTPPADMCRRVIQAAGGVVEDDPSKYDKDTMVLVGGEKASDQDVARWKGQGIPCIAPGFLIDYITKDQHNRPTWESYAVGS